MESLRLRKRVELLPSVIHSCKPSLYICSIYEFKMLYLRKIKLTRHMNGLRLRKKVEAHYIFNFFQQTQDVYRPSIRVDFSVLFCARKT